MIIQHLKTVLVNIQAAKATSLISMSVSIVWNFGLFWQHFVYVGLGAYFDFMKIPAIGFFILSFIFQFRLLQEIFKGHYQHLIGN